MRATASAIKIIRNWKELERMEYNLTHNTQKKKNSAMWKHFILLVTDADDGRRVKAYLNVNKRMCNL